MQLALSSAAKAGSTRMNLDKLESISAKMRAISNQPSMDMKTDMSKSHPVL